MARDKQSFARWAKIEELVERINSAGDPHLRGLSIELVQLLMDLHGEGLAHMLEIARGQGTSGSDLIQRFAEDPLAAQMLMLHNLHPVDLKTRVTRALDEVRPMLKSHGGDVALLEVQEGVVRLRLDGSCHGCPSSSLTLRNAIEAAIYAAASDISGLEVVGVVDEAPSSGFVPLQAIKAG